MRKPKPSALRSLGFEFLIGLPCSGAALACAPAASLLPDVRAEVVSVHGHDGSGPTHDLRGGVVLAFSGTPRPPSPPLPEVPTVTRVPDDTLALAMRARFADEPDVRQVVQAALEAAGLDPELAEAGRRRARRSAWLPDLRVGATRQRGVDASARGTTADTSIQVGRDDALRLEASMTFSLARLVYGNDEVAWSRERRALLEARAGLVRDVVELFVRRRRLIVELELLHEDDAAKRLELEETEALLEAFTNGNFSRMMAGRARPP